MAIKIKKPLCKKVEKVAKAGSKTKKKSTNSLTKKERIKAIKTRLKLR